MLTLFWMHFLWAAVLIVWAWGAIAIYRGKPAWFTRWLDSL